MDKQELIAFTGDLSYDSPVTGEELWRAVGRALRDHREDRRLNASDVHRAGGPTNKTVTAIDSGEIGNVESLTTYAEALGLSIADIIKSILAEGAISPEAAALVRIYDEDLRDDVRSRTALVLAAEALAARAAERRLPPGRAAKGGGSRR